MEISEACRRTIETWPRFAEELRARIICLANDGFVAEYIEIAPEKNGCRFVMVFSSASMSMWWQRVEMEPQY